MTRYLNQVGVFFAVMLVLQAGLAIYQDVPFDFVYLMRLLFFALLGTAVYAGGLWLLKRPDRSDTDDGPD